MRRFTFLMTLVLAVLISMNSNAQRTCAAHDHFLEQLQQSPKMQEKVNELEEYTQKFVRTFAQKAGETRQIPVNVIVVYSNSQENISDAQIQSQIAVLNEDYGGTNTDINNTPSEFQPVTAYGTGISFYISNIERHYDNTTSWGTNDAVKYAYPPTSPETTLNMWVCNIGGGILGYAQFPGGAAATDGVVFSPQYCGSSDYDDGSFYLSAPFDKGRTAVHEVGHYLNLRHIWGDGNCNADDYVDDTPLAGAANYGCPSYPDKSCTSNGGWTSDMFMNYMDYVDDQCMYMFSEGQNARMWACLNSDRINLGTSGGNIPPTANANGPYTGDPGVAVSFSSAGSSDSDGSIASYLWDFGDGATSTAANPSHTYAAEGIYNVTLTVTDNEGATGNDNTTATIGNVCTGTQACDGNVTLTLITDRYASETSWELRNSANQLVESGSGYSNSTTYTINWNLSEDTYTFTIFDSYGDGICCSYGSGSYAITDGCSTDLGSGGAFGSSESKEFCVPGGTPPPNNPPTAEANGPYSGEEGTSISFSSAGSADSDGSIASYYWEFGDGGTSTAANPSHVYASAGNYTATLTVTDDDGDTGNDQASVSVTAAPVNQAPVAEANGPYSGDEGAAISFSSAGSTDSDGTIASYYWEFGDGGTSTAANPSHTYAAFGSYTATLTVTDDDGATDSDQASVTVNEVVVGEDYASLPYTTGFESGLDANWFTQGNTSYSRIQVTTANTPHSGSYHLTMDVTTNGNYNTNEAWMGLNLNGEDQVDLNFWWKEFGDETHTDDGVYFSDNGGASFVKVLDFTGSSTSNNTWYEFNLDIDQLAASNGLSLSSTFVVKFQQYDNYAITTDGFAFDDISVTAGSAPPPNVAPVAEANGPYSGNEGAAISFSSAGSTDSDGTIASYYWEFGDGGTSTAANPTHTYASFGSYTATLTVTDDDGATDSDQASVTVNEVTGGGTVTLVSEGFESDWGVWIDGGSDCRRYSGSRSYGGSYSINLQDNSGVSSSTYTNEDFNVTAFTSIDIEFYFYAYSMDNSNEDFWVQYFDGSSWYTVASYAEGIDFQNGTFYVATVNISNANYSFPSNAEFRFMCDASANYDDVYIDDITIIASDGSARTEGNSLTALGSALRINDITMEEGLQVYPNPATAELNIETAVEDNTVAHIYSYTGALMRSFELDKDIQTINIQDLTPGMYIIIVSSEDEIYRQKFIKR